MSQEATWKDGESKLSQTHSTGNIEPAYADGESGKVPFDKYVATGGTVTGPFPVFRPDLP